MNGYNTKANRPAGTSHRCANGYHNKCDRPCVCPCHQPINNPTIGSNPTPDKTT